MVVVFVFLVEIVLKNVGLDYGVGSNEVIGSDMFDGGEVDVEFVKGGEYKGIYEGDYDD